MFVARREKSENLYTLLQEQSIVMLQQLSGGVWSDFNPHDPGVTMLDLLNYALLELNYKLDFPFEEYLGGKQSGKLNMQRFGVFPSKDIFSESIVTSADYEKLILNSSIDGIKECSVSLNEYGLYQITLDTAAEADKQHIKTEVEALYHANRNLCENLDCIIFDTITGKTNRPRNERPSIRPDLRTITSNGMATGAYRSVQLDFPDCYGINENGIPVGTTTENQARIRQLKAYLLIFDYLIEYVSVQAAGVSVLFELSGRAPHYKLPVIHIPDIGELIDRDRITSAQIDHGDFRDQQKSRYLDMLDVIYGEDTSNLFTCRAKELSEVNRMRAELTAQLPRFNAERFRSFNLLDKEQKSTPTIKKFISVLTGFPFCDEKPLTNVFSRHNLKLVRDNYFFNHHGNMPNMGFVCRESDYNWARHDMEPVPQTEIIYNERAVYRLRIRINLLWDSVVFESFLIYGTNPEYYRIVDLKEQEGYLLVFKHPEMQRWINLGSFHSKADLIETANILRHFLSRLVGECSSFYLLEHILLNSYNHDTQPVENIENHTLSVIMPYWVQKLHDSLPYEDLLMERLPAHLDVRFLWLHVDKVYTFERLYFPWKKALANHDKQLVDRYAFEIKRFLKYNTPAHEDNR